MQPQSRPRFNYTFVIATIAHVCLLYILFNPYNFSEAARQGTNPVQFSVELSDEIRSRKQGAGKMLQPNQQNEGQKPKGGKKGKKGKGKGKGKGQGDKAGQIPGGGGDFAADFNLDKEKWGKLLERLKQNENMGSRYQEKFDDFIPSSGVSQSYIHRKRHYEDIIVKDVFPTLETIDKPFKDLVKQAPEDLNYYIKRNQIIDDYRKWKKGELKRSVRRVEIKKNSEEERREPLKFPKKPRMQYFDKTMTMSKEDQLDEFIRDYMPHDPDKGDLAESLRDLFYENLLRSIYSWSTDRNRFTLDYFEENLNKEDYLKKAFYKLSQLSKTRTGIEILFTLENIYSTQERAWSDFFRVAQTYDRLPPSEKKRIHNEALRRVVERYQPQLKKKKIGNYHDAVRAYSKKRLEIADFMAANTPDYRRNDITFTRARILWESGIQLNDAKQMEEAITIWKSIRVSENADPKKHKDFLELESYKRLKPLLAQVKTPQDLARVRGTIQMIVQTRITKFGLEKQKRERKLLYP